MSAATLTEASLAIPLGLDVPTLEDPEATLYTAEESLKRGVAIKEEMRSLVAAEVDKRRKAAETVANGLRPKLLEELLGPKQRRGYLPPDATDADKVKAMRAARETANRRRVTGVSYIQVPA